MSVLVDQGLPGIMLLGMLLIWAWRSAGAVTKRSGMNARVWGYGAAISSALAVAAVAGQFSPYLKAEVQIWLLGLLMCMKGLADREAVLEPTTQSPRDAERHKLGPRRPAWAEKAHGNEAAPTRSGMTAAGAPRQPAGYRDEGGSRAGRAAGSSRTREQRT
jgi:hypothetical protein